MCEVQEKEVKFIVFEVKCPFSIVPGLSGFVLWW